MFEILVLDDKGREVLSAHTVLIRDKDTRVPLAIAKSKGDGVLFLTVENPDFIEVLNRSIFPSDLKALGSRVPTEIRRVQP